MIGQKNLQSRIQELIDNKTFPRFTILVGQDGSGRKLISYTIAKKLDAPCVVAPSLAVEDIRSVITEAYKISMPVVYVFADADKMSGAAKNALLKITEEPPRNAYFILTLTDLNTTLSTVKSRGVVMYMDPYTPQEISDYYNSIVDTSATTEYEANIIKELCETPGEVDSLIAMGIKEFYDYTVKVVDNIATVTGSNSFKIANKIQFKETDENKYDLRLFWKAFMSVCSDRLREDPVKYAAGIQTTSKYMQELRITGINKQSTFDMWLLDIRQEWM